MVVGVSIFLILTANIYSRLALGKRDAGHPKRRSAKKYKKYNKFLKKYKKNYLLVPLRQAKSYGQHGIRDCESSRDRVTNWLYLFLVPLASFNLLQYYTVSSL